MPGRVPSPAAPTATPLAARLRAWAPALLAGMLLLLPVPARASGTTASFLWAQTGLGSGLGAPSGMTVGSDGSVYIADPGNGRVVRETPAADGTFTQRDVYHLTGSQPKGVAVDSHGNVYLTDYINGDVIQVPWNQANQSYDAPTALLNNQGRPWGVAVDAGDAVFFSGLDQALAPYLRQAVPPTVAGDPWTVSPVTITGTTPTNPAGMAFNSAGMLFLADPDGNQVLQGTPSAGTYNASPLTTGVPGATAVGIGPSAIYIALASGNKIMKYESGTLTTLAQGLHAPAGVAVNPAAAGDRIYYSDTTDNKAYAILPANDFGQVKAGTASAPVRFWFQFNTTLTPGNEATVTLQGASGPGQAFRFSQSGTTAAGAAYVGTAFQNGDLAYVDATFNPANPGVQYGAVQLWDNGNPAQAIATVYVQGTGTGPQVVFPRSMTPSAVIASPNLSYPTGVAVGADGSIYVADRDINGFWQLRKFSSGATFLSLLASHFAEIDGVAVDGAGVVYFTCQDQNLYRVDPAPYPAPGGYAGPVMVNGITLASSAAVAVAVDSAGAVYLTDPVGDNVTRQAIDIVGGIPTAGTATILVGTVVGGTLATPTSVALVPDGSGDLLLGDSGGTIWKIPYSPIGAGFATPLITPGNGPVTGLALDAANGVYYTQGTTASSTIWQVPVATTLGAGVGIALDPAGNVYVIDRNANALYRYDAATAPALAFGDQPVGTSSSPQTLTILNNGNRTLTFPASTFSMDTNPSLHPASYSLAASSTFQPIPSGGTPQTLDAGNPARFDVVFVPTGLGVDNGSMQVFDDHLNLATSQSVNLTGNGTVGTAIISLPSAYQTKGYTGQPVAADYTIAPQGATATATYTGTSVAYGPTSTPPTDLGDYQVTLEVNGPNFTGPSATGGLTITQGTAAVALNAGDLNQVYGQTHAVGYTSSGVAATVTYSGTTYAGADVPSSTTPPTEAGGYMVTVTTTDPNYLAATDSKPLTVAKAPVAVTLAQADLLNQVYNGQPHPVGFTTAPSLAPGSVTVNYSLYGVALGGPRALAAAGGPPVNAGRYSVNAVVNHPNYTGNAQATLDIGPAAATVTLDPASLTQPFDNTPRSIRFTVDPTGVPVTVTYVGDAYPASTTPPSAAGSYTVTAAIADPNYTGVPATNTFRITAAPTYATLDLTADANPIQAYQTVKLTATATAPGGLAPTGKVTFSSLDAPVSAEVVLVPSPEGGQTSTASLPISILPAGTWTIIANYDAGGKNTASAVLRLVVNPLPPVTLSNPGKPGQSLSVTVGRNLDGACQVTVHAPIAFTTPVQFKVTGLPSFLEVKFPPPVFPAAELPPVRLHFHIPSIYDAMKPGGPVSLPIGGGAAGVFLACGLVAFPWAGRSRRRSRLWTGLALLLAVGLMGCWSRNPRSTTYHGSVVASAANAPAGTPPLATIPVDVTVLE